MKAWLLAALEVVWTGVRWGSVLCAGLIFICVSAASVTGAHVQAGVVR